MSGLAPRPGGPHKGGTHLADEQILGMNFYVKGIDDKLARQVTISVIARSPGRGDEAIQEPPPRRMLPWIASLRSQ
jgi:hypothetical protein